jgi:hypothetical protein
MEHKHEFSHLDIQSFSRFLSILVFVCHAYLPSTPLIPPGSLLVQNKVYHECIRFHSIAERKHCRSHNGFDARRDRTCTLG